MREAVNHVARMVDPYPVAALDVSENSIICVNDHYFEAPLQEPSSNNHRAQTSSSEAENYSQLHTSTVQQINGTAPPRISFFDNTNGAGSSEEGQNSNGTFQHSDVDKSLRFIGEHPDPDTPPGGSVSDEKFPFIAVLTVEDPAGLQQTVKIMFCIEINSSSRGTQVITAVRLDNLRLVLPFPGSLAQASNSNPYRNHFRSIGFAVSIGPDLSNAGVYEPFYQHPQMNWYISKIARSREYNVGFAPSLSVAPSVQAPISLRLDRHWIILLFPNTLIFRMHV